MKGIKLSFDLDNFDDLQKRLDALLDPPLEELSASIAALGESQTRRRISDEKTAPDGTPWKPNRAGTPILKQTGRNLLDSVASISSASTAEWGATWEYAHVHQEGAVIKPKTAKALVFQGANGQVFVGEVTIPARPFLGLSADNRAEMGDLITDFFSDVINDGAWRAP